MHDRRASPRWTTKIDVDYRTEGTFLFASITDISAFGIFLCTSDPLPQGSRLQLRFAPPQRFLGDGEADAFELEGEVVWINDGSEGACGMGVRFLGVTAAEQRRLLDLVRAIAYLDEAAAN